jgi:hypothetical protein
MAHISSSRPGKRRRALAEVERLTAELETLLPTLRGDRNRSRTTEGARELRKDGQVGMEPDACDAANA